MKKSIFFKIICVVLCVSLAGFVFASCGKEGDVETPTSAAQTSVDEPTAVDTPELSGDHPQVMFTMENGGSFLMELYPEYAPASVENFLNLVNEGFYDGLEFHRVMDGFMAQGGASDKDIPSIYGEFASNGFKQNTLKHTRGIVSMARTNEPDSASSQFFICYGNAEWLDGDYAAFGKVIQGMETVDAFLDIPRTYNVRGELSVPTQPIVIESAVQVD